MSLRPLTGPRLPPASDAEATSLVVLVHGYGADGQDLIELGRYWAQALPGAAFVAPNGPDRCAGSPQGYQWFPISRLSPGELASGVTYAAPLLERFLDEEMRRTGLGPERTAIVGFSQGTMLALHVALRRKVAFAGVVGFSGALAAPERLEAELASRPPVYLAHGEADQVVPPQATPMAATVLAMFGVPVIWHMSPGIGHGIAPDMLDQGGRFLANALKGKLAGSIGPQPLPEP